MGTRKYWVALGVVAAMTFSNAPTHAQIPPPNEVRRLGESIELAESSSLTVDRDDAPKWLSDHPVLSSPNGIVVGIQFTFKGLYGFMFGIDHQDASKSDIVLRCGNRAFNFTKFAALNTQTGEVQVVDEPYAGGMRFKGADGRDYGMMMVDESGFGNHQMVFFFEMPADCAHERLLFSITQEHEKVKQIVWFDAGTVGM